MARLSQSAETSRPWWRDRDRLVTAGLYLSFLVAAAASFQHVRDAFLQLERPGLVGQVNATLAALGIELALLSLALMVHARRRAGRVAAVLWLALGGFVAVSAYGNARHSLQVQVEMGSRQIPAEVLEWIGWADLALLSVSLPVAVAVVAYLLSVRAADEAAGASRVAYTGRQQLEGRRTAGSPNGAPSGLPEAQGRPQDLMQVLDVEQQTADRLNSLLGILEHAPDWIPNVDLAEQLEVHRNTVGEDLQLLEQAGLAWREPGSRQWMAGPGRVLSGR